MRVLKRCAYPTYVKIECHHNEFLACKGCVNNIKLAHATRYCSSKCHGNLVVIVTLDIENLVVFSLYSRHGNSFLFAEWDWHYQHEEFH